MNDTRLDTRLVAATTRSDGGGAFTAATMQRIRMKHILTRSHKNKWALRSLFRLHKIASIAALALVIGTVGFTGYAYATNTNPVELITRIIDGDNPKQMKATYQGHAFVYGENRKYSDVAITAYAELSSVQNLAMIANDTFGAPKAGVEYFPDSYNGSYVYPRLATITSVAGGEATLTEQYLLGDKMEQSRDLDTSLTVATSSIQYYSQGEPAQLRGGATPRLVALFPQAYLRHTIATNNVERVTIYFAFALSYPLDDFKEAAQPVGDRLGDPANMPLYEPNWGSISDLCLNNPADTCSNDKIYHDEGQGLYVLNQGGGRGNDSMFNPNAVYAAGDESKPSGLLLRVVQGKITELDRAGFTIRTSSGQTWQIAYPANMQLAFASTYSPLKIGDTIAAHGEQSIYDLNSRTLDTTHVMFMMRL